MAIRKNIKRLKNQTEAEYLQELEENISKMSRQELMNVIYGTKETESTPQESESITEAEPEQTMVEPEPESEVVSEEPELEKPEEPEVEPEPEELTIEPEPEITPEPESEPELEPEPEMTPELVVAAAVNEDSQLIPDPLVIPEEKELKKLGKNELIDLIHELQNREQSLISQLQDSEERNLEREIRLEQSGSIAEAALQVNHIFEKAQIAADVYLTSVKELKERTDKQCEEKLAETERQCDEMFEETEKEVRAIWARFKKKIEQTLKAHEELKEVLDWTKK